jgi:hypothetical protein
VSHWREQAEAAETAGMGAATSPARHEGAGDGSDPELEAFRRRLEGLL